MKHQSNNGASLHKVYVKQHYRIHNDESVEKYKNTQQKKEIKNQKKKDQKLL